MSPRPAGAEWKLFRSRSHHSLVMLKPRHLAETNASYEYESNLSTALRPVSWASPLSTLISRVPPGAAGMTKTRLCSRSPYRLRRSCQTKLIAEPTRTTGLQLYSRSDRELPHRSQAFRWAFQVPPKSYHQPTLT